MSKTTIYFITFYGTELEVHCNYSIDEGYLRNSNGDGLPSSISLEVENVYIGNAEVSELIIGGSLWDELEERVKEKIGEENNDQDDYDYEDYQD